MIIFRAGRYYFEHDMDLDKAHTWVSKAAEMRDNAFWMYKLKAEIEAAMGKYDMAINTAEKSIELAEKAGNEQYVKFNKTNIEKWSKM